VITIQGRTYSVCLDDDGVAHVSGLHASIICNENPETVHELHQRAMLRLEAKAKLGEQVYVATWLWVPQEARSPSSNEIRDARDRAGHTQKQAAETVECGQRKWQEWESGQQKMSPDLWEKYLTKTAVVGGDGIVRIGRKQ